MGFDIYLLACLFAVRAGAFVSGYTERRDDGIWCEDRRTWELLLEHVVFVRSAERVYESLMNALESYASYVVPLVVSFAICIF